VSCRSTPGLTQANFLLIASSLCSSASSSLLRLDLTAETGCSTPNAWAFSSSTCRGGGISLAMEAILTDILPATSGTTQQLFLFPRLVAGSEVDVRGITRFYNPQEHPLWSFLSRMRGEPPILLLRGEGYEVRRFVTTAAHRQFFPHISLPGRAIYGRPKESDSLFRRPVVIDQFHIPILLRYRNRSRVSALARPFHPVPLLKCTHRATPPSSDRP
jgi:hypothetical protein